MAVKIVVISPYEVAFGMFIQIVYIAYQILYMLKPDNNKPYPIRLGGIKSILQQQAFKEDRSLHYWILKILKDHIKKTTNKRKV